MTALRVLFKWIGKHQIFSTVILLAVVGGAWFANRMINRSAGQVTGPLEKGTIIESVYGIGTVTANKIWRIKPGIVNTISELWVQEGDFVTKGQKLVQNDIQVWRAPFSGTITSLPFKVGENVFAQVALLTLVDLSDRYLIVSMEQQGAMRVKKGQSVKMSFDSIRQKNYDGRVVSVYSNDTSYLARIDITSLPASVLPGMTADTAIEIQRHDNVLLVPVAAIENGNSVWRKRGSEIPKKIEIKTGIIDKDIAEVTSGDLEPGDRTLLRKDLSK